MGRAWPPASLHQRRLDLQDARSLLRTLPDDAADNVQRALARYLVVRATGYLEAVRDDVADTYVSAKAAPEVLRRVQYHLRSGQGVTPKQLEEFVKSFNPEWHIEFCEFLDDDDGVLRSDIGSLVASRNKIAHGDGETVTVSRALRWSEASEKVSKWLISRFDPSVQAGSTLRV